MRAILLAAVVASGCQIKLDTDPVAAKCVINMTAPSCLAAPGHMELSWIQPNVFTKNCALSACHDGATNNKQGTHPDLRAGHSYMSLVGGVSDLDASRILVVPSDVDQSYLAMMMGIIQPAEANPEVTKVPKEGLMPQNSGVLCCQKLDAVAAWIAAGAADN